MKKVLILGQLLLILFTSCYFHSYKTYKVNESLQVKRKYGQKDKTKIHQGDLRSLTKQYHIPENVCEDSVKLKTIATKIFKNNHKHYLHSYFDTCKLIITNDTVGYFQYYFRIIHGHDQMTFDRKNRIIILHKAWTGNF